MKLFRLFIISLFLLFGIITKSQIVFNGGIMGGLVGSQVAGDTYSGFDKLGFSGGVFANLEISSHSLLQMELSFIQKGSRFNPEPEKGLFDEYIMRLNYIELPVLFQYSFLKKFKAEAGIGCDFLLSHFEEKNHQSVADNPFREMNLNLIFGLYYAIDEKFSVNFRTNNSVTGLRKNKQGVPRFGSYGQYSDALVLSIYYQINRF
ncbi:MAG: PorT family protein [Bacteroidales bacterium]|nr:PorT family protein [Bacteroidales bacterium]